MFRKQLAAIGFGGFLLWFVGFFVNANALKVCQSEHTGEALILTGVVLIGLRTLVIDPIMKPSLRIAAVAYVLTFSLLGIGLVLDVNDLAPCSTQDISRFYGAFLTGAGFCGEFTYETYQLSARALVERQVKKKH